jgi:hypothetical protein
MERTRDWRRWKADIVFLKRIKIHNRRFYWHVHIDSNGLKISNLKWIDKIGMQSFYIYKSQTTLFFVTRNKSKWGKKGKRGFNWSSDYNNRPKDKVRFLKLLKEDGFK